MAGVLAVYEVLEGLRHPHKRYILRPRDGGERVAEGGQRKPVLKSDLNTQRFFIVAKKCKKLLGPLCDLQAVTGIGIITAGWAQIGSIDYYHEDLVIGYWWLTLNSFWTGRVDFLDFDSKADLRITVRRVTILCSCILGLSFQGYIIVREENNWIDDGGPCDRYEDGSSPIPWMAGLALFCIAILSVTFPKTRKLNDWYFKLIGGVSDKLKTCYENSQKKLHEITSQSTYLQWLGAISNVALVSISRGCWFVFVLWFSVWSYGDCYWPAAWCVYVLFNIWNTFDVITIRRWNQRNIQGDEGRMGFGQVLSLVLIGTIVFNAIDIFCGKPNYAFESLELLRNRAEHDFKYSEEYENFEARADATEMYERGGSHEIERQNCQGQSEPNACACGGRTSD